MFGRVTQIEIRLSRVMAGSSGSWDRVASRLSRRGEKDAGGSGRGAPLSRRDWNPVSYVRSTKAILVRCVREKGIELSADGRVALDRLPDSFDVWRADPAGALR